MCVHREPVPTSVPEYKVLVLGHRLRARRLAWVLEKGCVHSSADWYCTQTTCQGTKCEQQPEVILTNFRFVLTHFKDKKVGCVYRSQREPMFRTKANPLKNNSSFHFTPPGRQIAFLRPSFTRNGPPYVTESHVSDDIFSFAWKRTYKETGLRNYFFSFLGHYG